MEKTSIIDLGMDHFSSVCPLISQWPSRKGLAEDLGVTVDRVHKWAQANAIPAKYHYDLLRAANRRSIPLTAEVLTEMHRRAPNSDCEASR